jgi:hypothetical protein
VLLAALAPAAAGSQTPARDPSCVDVQAGSARSFDCINRQLRAKAANEHPSGEDDGVVSATSAPNRAGTFNQSATREYLGSSFGHSAVPQAHAQTVAPSFGAVPR